MKKVIKCKQCTKRLRNNGDDWNVVYDMGVITGYLCPDCQTVDEMLEAVFNEETIDYSTARTILAVSPEGVADCLSRNDINPAEYDIKGIAKHINGQVLELLNDGVPIDEPTVLSRYASTLLENCFENYHLEGLK